MNKLLAKLFIKNYSDTKDSRVRNAYGTLSSIFGIICNALLAAAKIVIGALSASIALLADGINNLSDLSSSAISLVGFRVSNRPPDKKHPFGHARMEYLSSLIIAFIIIMVGFQLTGTSIDNIISGSRPELSIMVFSILGVSIFVKAYMAYFYHKNAKLIDSVALKAVCIDSINDTIATTVVLISSIVCYYSNVNLDGYTGILVSLYIMIAGIKLTKDTLSPLLGEKPDPNLVSSIASAIRAYPEVLGIHDLVIHNYGPNKHFVTLHAEVDGSIDVMTSHEVIDNIERSLTNRDMQCIIHMDPIITNDPRIDTLKEEVYRILMSIDNRLCLHDFRVIIGPNRTNVIFDLVLPDRASYDETKLAADIELALKEYDSACSAIINFDYNYV